MGKTRKRSIIHYWGGESLRAYTHRHTHCTHARMHACSPVQGGMLGPAPPVSATRGEGAHKRERVYFEHYLNTLQCDNALRESLYSNGLGFRVQGLGFRV